MGFYFFDKTKLIEQLLEQWGKVNLFTRPRRFGKTLNMSMLKYFFEIGTDETLFDGLYISKNQELCEEYMGKFPVIFLSLKGVDGLTFDSAKDRFIQLIGNEAQRFRFLLDSDKLTEDDKNIYRALISLQDGKYVMGEEVFISADKTTKNEIERLIAGETIEKSIRMELTYDEIDNSIDNLWSILFTIGYLTQKDNG